MHNQRSENSLQINDLHAYYGESHVLHGVNLSVNRGEVVTLLGRNGAGRSTILKSIMGLVSKRSGSIKIEGKETIRLPTHKIAPIGVGYCPEERGIFSALNVEENLLLPPIVTSPGMALGEIYSMFPNLLERKASKGTFLSGGEQQMLAIARILRAGANLLLLDEITEGLAPVIVKSLGQLIEQLKVKGFTVVLVEQNFRFAASLADRHYVIEHGNVAEMIDKENLDSNIKLLNKYLGV